MTLPRLALFGICLSNFSCSEHHSAIKPKGFMVSKIDSTGNYYLIYVKKSDTLYKLISKKTDTIGCSKIIVNKEYKFSLHSIWCEPMMMGNIDVAPCRTPHVTCWHIDSISTICLEREIGVYDIFDSKNLKGLCYIED